MISFRGYSENQLLEMIKFWEKNNKMTDKPKHILTRGEAINLLRNNVFSSTDTGQVAMWVDFFITAGMLEIKEEETINSRLSNFIDRLSGYNGSINHLQQMADKAGLKIIKNNS